MVGTSQIWRRTGVAAVAVAVGLGLAGCSSGSSGKAGGATTTPSAAASGGGGNQPPVLHDTVLTDSRVFTRMSAADQALVRANVGLPFEQFEQLDEPTRAKVALVLMDANSAAFLKAAGELVLPGEHGQALKDIYIPAENRHTNEAQDEYTFALTATPDKIKPDDNGAPYQYDELAEAVAFHMASSGNPHLLDDAKKIIGGTVFFQGAQADGDHGDLANKLSRLEQVSAGRSDPDRTLHWPQANTNGHDFTVYLDGPFQGQPFTVTTSFSTWNNDAGVFEPGRNEDGATACVYRPTPILLTDNTYVVGWMTQECTNRDGAVGIGVLQPNN